MENDFLMDGTSKMPRLLNYSNHKILLLCMIPKRKQLSL